MNNINYKELRSYKNLPKFDPGMTPISTGYQMGDNYVPIGQSQQGTPINTSFKDQAYSTVASSITPMVELGKGLGSTWKAVGAANAAKEASEYASSYASQTFGTNAATNYAALGRAVEAGEKAAGTTAAAKGAMAASRTAAALAAIYGGYESVTAADTYGRSPLSTGDLLNASGRSTDYANGVGYERIDGYDASGAARALRDYNNLGMTKSVTGGATFGAGAGTLIGSLFTPAGSVIGGLIGAGLGALGGAVTGWINRGKAKRKMHEMQYNFANNVEGYNRQNEAEAATKGLTNQYYQSHYGADKGLRKCDDGLAFVNDREVVGQVEKDDDGRLRVSNAHAVSSPFGRADVKLENVDPVNGFVIGHRIGPDGVELNEKALMYERMFNSHSPYLQKIGEEGLLATLNIQDHTKKDNNPKPQYARDIEKIAGGMPLADKGINMRKYNCGKGLRKMDYGGRDALKASHYLNIIPAALGMVEGYNELRDAEKMPTTALNSYVEAPSQMQAINSMPTVANINPLLREITDQDRYNDYAINQTGGLTKGQKMLMRSQAQANRLKTYADAYAKKWDLEQQLGATKANAWLNVSNNMATRAQQALREQIDNFMKAQGAKYSSKAMARKNMFTPLYAMAENWNNNNWQLAMMNLYEQNLSQKQKDSLRA